eukprot:jgi/Botrbrau1/22943/Bobra.0030s0019.1
MAQDLLIGVPESSIEAAPHHEVVQTGKKAGKKSADEKPSGKSRAQQGAQNRRRRQRKQENSWTSNGSMDESSTTWLEGAIKVSSNSNVKAVAGKLAHSSRTGEPPIILAIGHTCLNTAVKAVAIARNYVREKPSAENISDVATFDIVCQPAFRKSETGVHGRPKGACLALYLFKRQSNGKEAPQEDIADLTVGSGSDPTTVAGALAARVRESKPVCLTAIGVDAVANAIRAVCHARMYLEDDNVDILARPQFIQVSKDTLTLSAIRIYIGVESKVSSEPDES